MIIILFEDYKDTGVIYHVVTIADLERTLKKGIKFNDKGTYIGKYKDFHSFLDENRNEAIEAWAIRSQAIFGSLNFKADHKWHSHSAILSVKINEDRCWVCNENIANFLYEPLLLQKAEGFEEAKDFIKRNGIRIARDYWGTSLSFKDNLSVRLDKKEGYDAEVLILHDIPPENIELLYIASDHRYMSIDQWEKSFCTDGLFYSKC